MTILIKKILSEKTRKIERIVNRFGKKKKCYVCGATFDHFTKWRGGSKALSEFSQKLNIVGSDVDNFGCMYCGSTDRERHLYMFFDKLELWKTMKDARILHFAPEKYLSEKISGLATLEYVKADLYPSSAEITKIDATDIPAADNTYDFVIANHVLEHIPHYAKAVSEFYRVLKPGAIAILQTPYSKLLKGNFEDENINTKELRSFFYGQEDHVRIFGEHALLRSIEEAGFNLQIKQHDDWLDADSAQVYGINFKEDLIQAIKPMNLAVSHS